MGKIADTAYDIMSGGNKINEEMTDTVYDYQAMIRDAEAKVYEESGYMTSDEADAYLKGALEQNESDRSSAVSAVKGVSVQNIILNTAGIVGSVANISGATGKLGAVMTDKGKTMMSAFNDSSRSVLSKIGNGVAGGTLRAGGATLQFLYGKGANGIGAKGTGIDIGSIKGFGLANSLMNSKNLILKAAGAGVYMAPGIMSFAYTNSRSSEISEALVDTIDTLDNQYTAIMADRENLNDDMGKTYTDWAEGYEAGCAELQGQLSSGQITQSEYDAKYAAFVESSSQALDEAYAKYPEMGRRIVENQSAVNMAGFMMDKNIDPDTVMDHSEYAEQRLGDPANSASYEAAKEHYEIANANSTGNKFLDFISSMHAAIIHYCPVIAYAEAAVRKGADMALEVAESIFPGYSHTEQYANKGIGDIASMVCDNAEADFANGQRLKELENANEASLADAGVAPREPSAADTEPEAAMG